MRWSRTDWRAAWTGARRASSAGKHRASRDGTFWDKKAAWFDRNTRGDVAEAAEVTARVAIDGNMTVLDVGAGTGRFAIPLARVARAVTAIEPSAGMATILQDRARTEGIDNITIIPKRWEDVRLGQDIQPHDIVIAAYSLDVDDMGAALDKINAAARAHAFVFTWIRRTFWDMDALWPLVRGEPHVPEPGYIHIVNILHDAGIHANVHLMRKRKVKVFASMDEAVQDVREALFLDDDTHDDAIRDHVSRVLDRQPDGTCQHRGTSERVVIWWSKDT